MTVQLFPAGCPVCETKTDTQVHCTKEDLDYIRCKDCDLIYQKGSVEVETMMNCYTGGPLKRLRRQILNRFRRLERQRDFNIRMTRAHEIFSFSSSKTSKEKGQYLDIGCNKGFNIYAAEEKGWVGFGNELIEELMTPILNSKPDIKDRLKVGSFLDLAKSYDDKFFDLVTCVDVIEHFTEPKVAMSEMIRILKPGGVVVYQTPGATKDKIEMFESWDALKPNEHLLLFNQENFKTMAMNAGFSKVEFAEKPFDVSDGNFVATCWKA